MTAPRNELSGAEAFVRMLQLHGVRHVFGLCGDPPLELDHFGAREECDHCLADCRQPLAQSAGRYVIDREMAAHGRTLCFDCRGEQCALVPEMVVNSHL